MGPLLQESLAVQENCCNTGESTKARCLAGRGKHQITVEAALYRVSQAKPLVLSKLIIHIKQRPRLECRYPCSVSYCCVKDWKIQTNLCSQNDRIN